MKKILIICKGKDLDRIAKTIVFVKNGIGAVHELGQISEN
uniref:Uncharacterized protein n=1 Tax=viral metagenome TaxID=1070528 RepID=A0A6M3KUI1_9ZZZZ